MRNTWYPRQRAEYITVSTLQGLKPQKLVAERDFTFGMKQEEKSTPLPVEEAKTVEVQTKTKLLPVRRFYEVLLSGCSDMETV